ncbi:MAG TPA: hypothetical protein VJK07_01305 [Candidatus Nanoarchaeia archaeon]|nr:hypothetical protein [Candidatus Nanoarchaeia archaeon]
MSDLYIIPRWFFGFDVVLELLFGVATLAVALYAFRIYSISRERQCQTMGIGFLSTSLAYFVWAGVSLLLIIENSTGRVSLEQLTRTGLIGVFSYVFFSLIGLSVLVYMTFPSRPKRLFSLIGTLVLLVLIFSQQKSLAFYFVSAFLTFFVLSHYVQKYARSRRTTTLLVMLGFAFIFLGMLDFTLASVREVHYVIGHVLLLIGYMLVMASLLVVLAPLRRTWHAKEPASK